MAYQAKEKEQLFPNMPTKEPMEVRHVETIPAMADKSKRRKTLDDLIDKAGG